MVGESGPRVSYVYQQPLDHMNARYIKVGVESTAEIVINGIDNHVKYGGSHRSLTGDQG